MWHNAQSASSKGVLPVTPGHESAGTIEAVGDGVTGWSRDLVVVQGAGTIGQLSGQVALARGAATVVMTGTAIDGVRFEKARRMGVHRTVDVTAEDPVAVVAGLHDGLGADLVVDATGASAALRQSLEDWAR